MSSLEQKDSQAKDLNVCDVFVSNTVMKRHLLRLIYIYELVLKDS